MSEHGSLAYVGHDECDRSKAYCCMACVLGNFACGWAFDAGVLEAQRDRARSFYERMFTRDIAQRMEIAAGTVAAERERCLDACYRESRFAHPSVDAVREFIESGAPAPREG